MLNFWRRRGAATAVAAAATSVLIVEDSRTQAATLAASLARAGFKTEIAPHGEAALNRLGRPGIDVVVTDVVMPGISGFELCRTVKAATGDAIPVLLLTALEDPLDVVRGIRCGADYFLTKPLDVNELIESLRRIARRQEAKEHGGSDFDDFTFLGERLQLSSDKEQIFGLLLQTFERFAKTRQADERRLHELAARQERLTADAARDRAAADQLRAGVQALHEEMALATRPAVQRIMTLRKWLKDDVRKQNFGQIASYADDLCKALEISVGMLENVQQRLARTAQSKAVPAAAPRLAETAAR